MYNAASSYLLNKFLIIFSIIANISLDIEKKNMDTINAIERGLILTFKRYACRI